MKTCSKCHREKAATDFGQYGTGLRKGQVRSTCRECQNSYSRQYKSEHSVASSLTLRRCALMRRYGITLAQYDAMLAAQGGHCAICPATAPGGRGEAFHVDHDHATGVVRGLLCHYCNTAIGSMNDDPARLQAAANYLETSRVHKVA
jgi:hypothetical protein